MSAGLNQRSAGDPDRIGSAINDREEIASNLNIITGLSVHREGLGVRG